MPFQRNIASLCFVSNRACHAICTSRFKCCTQCCACHEPCNERCSKCCACHEICSSSAQSAAPATKPATGGSKCCACHEICTSSAPSAAPATKSGTEGAQCAAPATKSAHPDSHRAALPGGSQWQAQLFVKGYVVFHTN